MQFPERVPHRQVGVHVDDEIKHEADWASTGSLVLTAGRRTPQKLSLGWVQLESVRPHPVSYRVDAVSARLYG